MKIGEIVEILIRVKDDYGYGDFRREAVEQACNMLDKLPRMEEATEYEPACQMHGMTGERNSEDCHKRMHGGGKSE